MTFHGGLSTSMMYVSTPEGNQEKCCCSSFIHSSTFVGQTTGECSFFLALRTSEWVPSWRQKHDCLLMFLIVYYCCIVITAIIIEPLYIYITCLLLLLIPPFLEWWPCWPSYFWLWLNLRATDGWGMFFHINFTEFSASSRLRSLWDSIGFPSPSDWRPIGGHLQFAFEPSLPWQHSKVPKCVDCQLPKSLSPSFPMVIANENEDIAVSAGPKARR